SSERMTHERHGAVTDRLEDRAAVRADVPRRLPGGVAMAEQVGREDMESGKLPGERREVSSVVANAMEAHDTGSSLLAPLVERRRPAVGCSVASDPGTISVRRSSRSSTSDKMMVPPRSMRNVPRCGAPFSSLKMPYALEAAPCGQKSDANVSSAPISFSQAR